MLLRSGQVARRFGVGDDAVRRWVSLGILPARRLPSGHLRFDITEVEALERSLEKAQPELVAAS